MAPAFDGDMDALGGIGGGLTATIGAAGAGAHAHVLLFALLIGAGIGFLSGAFGKGGSALATPLLHLAGVPAIVAIASPLPAVIPASWLASRPYARAGTVDRRVVRTGLLAGVPAVVAGALATRRLPGGPLVVATDVLVLVMGARILLTRHAPHADRAASPVPTARLVAVVLAVGLLSGLLGNSGGFLLAPLFMTVLGLPVHRALGTSLVLATGLAVPGTVVHAALGHVDWSLTLAFALASMPAAAAGARVALRTRERRLTLAYGMGLAVLAGGLLAFAH